MRKSVLNRAISLFLAVLLIISSASNFSVQAQETVNNLGGLAGEGNLRVEVNNGSMRVDRYSGGGFNKQFYQNSGLILSVDGTVSKLTDYWNHNNSSIPLVEPDSQVLDGNTVITTWTVGDLRVEQEVTLPTTMSQYIKLEWTVENTGSSDVSNVRLNRGVDTYLSGGDNGAGFWEPLTNTVGVTKTINNEQQRLSFQGVTPPESYTSKYYYSVDAEVEAGDALSNEIDSNVSTDNGYALSWFTGTLVANGSWSVVAYESFVSAKVVAAGDSQTYEGSAVESNFTVQNISDTTQEVTYTVSGPEGWSLTPEKTGDTILSGASTNIGVMVEPPEGANSGAYDIMLEVTADGAATQGIASVTIPKNDDARMMDLTIADGTLSPSFDEGIATYTVTVGNDVTSTRLTPTVYDSNARISIQGNSVVSGTTSPALTLDVGNNPLLVVVTAEDGSTQETYTINVNRAAPSSVATLTQLAVSEGVLTPSFSSNVTNYDVSVSNDITSIKLTPTVTESNATVTVDGNPVASGTSSAALVLEVGNNPVEVVVTAQDGTTQEIYTVNVVRASAIDAALSNLTSSEGALSPTFTPDVTDYEVSVGNNITSVRLTPTVRESNATVTVDGNPVASGTSSAALVLEVGNNPVEVVVTAQDGTTQEIYTVNVVRASAIDAALSNLTSSEGTLSPTFAPGVTDYEVSIGNNITSVTLTPTVRESNATVTVDGNPVASGTSSAALVLEVGNNPVEVVVTAQDGETQTTYTVVFTRAHSGNSRRSDTQGTTPKGTEPVAQVNGEPTVSGVVITEEADERKSTTIEVNEASLNEQLENKSEGVVVTVPFSEAVDTSTATLNGQMIKDMEEKSAILVVETRTESYTLPADQINITAVSESFGTNVTLSDIDISIEIVQPEEKTVEVVEEAAEGNGFALVVPAVEFNITCTYNEDRVHVKKFNAYVERRIAIPDGVDPNKITTGVVVDAEGNVRHVPTVISIENGIYYAVISSVTNSVYSVVWHPMTFEDVVGHWAADSINNLGSRMVVNGVDGTNYEADRDITRAEFTAIVVRALGLEPGDGNNDYSDVEDAKWYADYIETAGTYELILGYGDGNFGPMDKITREQAMTIIARAMQITDLESDSSLGILDSYEDMDDISIYALESIATCVDQAIVNGRTETLIDPKDNITRAETAAIVERLLKKSELID